MECLASFRAWMRPTNSALKMPYSASRPSWWELLCWLLEHHTAAAVPLPFIHNPSEKTRTCVSEGLRHWMEQMALSLSVMIRVLKLGVAWSGMDGSGC